jgi:6-phosphogluconolactonase
MDNSKQHLVFIGTYTEDILFGTGNILEGKGKGIYVSRFLLPSGEMEPCSLAQAVPNPSYLTRDPSHRFLYAVNELKEFGGAQTGAVSAFSLDPATGSLRFLNRQPSHGTDPCHLIVHKSGSYVLVANFGSGTVCVLPIQQDGSLGMATDVIQHQGSSVDPVRQTRPHAHAVVMDETGHYIFVPDLGMDKVMIYKFDTQRGKLKPNDEPWFQTTPGAGPRQLVMHPLGELAYLINELNSTVTALRYNKANGSLQEIQTITTLPAEFKGANTCAEIQISPSGKFLYASNRGHDHIVAYAINLVDGTLSCLGYRSTQGKTPRHFSIDPQGSFLLVANQDSDTVVTFRINPITGELSAAGPITHIPTPVCVKFL